VEILRRSRRAWGETGQYRPLVVNLATNEILAGNHVFEVVRDLVEL